MRLFFISLLLSFSVSFCSGQTYTDLVKDQTIQDFLEWKFNRDTVVNKSMGTSYFAFSSTILKWRDKELQRDSTASNSQYNYWYIYANGNSWLDTLLTTADKEFIVKQSQSYKTYQWLLAAPARPRAKKDHHYYVSLPLFSLDGQYALLKEVCYCGEDCGEEQITLYRYTQSQGWAPFRFVAGGVF